MKNIYYPIILLLSFFALIGHAQVPGNGATCFTAMCLHEQLGNPQNNQWRTSNPPQPTPPLSIGCGDTETNNNLFYIFCAADADVGIGLEFSNCGSTTMGLVGGLEMVLYEVDQAGFDPMNPDCNSVLTEIDCVSTNGLPVPMNQIGFRNNLTPGNYYMLMVDGYMFDYCDFTIQAQGVADLSDLPNEPTIAPGLPTEICVGETFDFEISDPEDCVSYSFGVRPGGGIMLDVVPGDIAGSGTGMTPGLYEICINAVTACTSEEYCYDIEVLPTPRIDPIVETIVVCDPMVDFCDYENFFSPGLNPDPFSMGWDISFHTSFNDAETGDNPITCPYDMSNSGLELLYIRTLIAGRCYSVQSFQVRYAQPRFAEIMLDDFCGPAELDMSVLIQLSDLFSTGYSDIGYYRDEGDAEVDAGEINPPIIDESGTYWVRVDSDTDPTCTTIASFDVNIVDVPEIDLTNPDPICALDTLRIDLKDIELIELTGDFNLDDYEIRYYDIEPNEGNLNNRLINTVVTEPGTYWVTVLVPVNSSTRQFCFSEPVPIVIDTVGPPVITMEGFSPNCPEDDARIIFNISQSGQFEIDYSVSNGDGNTIFTTNTQEIELLTVDNFTDTIWIKINYSASLDGSLCQPVNGDSIFIAPPISPFVRMYEDTTICRGDTARLYFEYNGSDALTIEYTDGTNFFTAENIEDGDFVEVSPDESTTYTITFADGTSGCLIQVQGEVTVDLYEIPEYEIVNISCLPTQEYVLEINFSNGVDGTYTIDDIVVGNSFTSNPIASGDSYQFFLSDVNGCGPVEISGTYDCDCDNSAGTMSGNTINVCVDEVANGFHNSDETVFPGDVFYFILHTGNGTTLGTLIDSSAMPSFSFDPTTMNTGQSYFISAITGNNDGSGGASRMDSCLQVSVGQEVIFYALPTATFGNDDAVCSGDDATLDISLTGSYPIEIDLDTNGVFYRTIIVYAGDTTLNVSLTNDIEWSITQIRDAQGCSDGVQDNMWTRVYAPVLYTLDWECNGDQTQYRLNITFISGTAPFLINSTDVVNGNFYQSNYVDSGTPITLTIEDANGCETQINETRDCNCTTDPGTINNDSPSLCSGDDFTPTVSTPPTLDANDVSGYILFSDPADPLGSILGFFSGTVTFLPGMNFGTTYYIAPIAGDDDGNGEVLLTDDCARIGNVIEIIWNATPEISVNFPAELCFDEDLRITLQLLTGTSPYTVDYTSSSGNGQWNIPSSNFDLVIPNTDLGIGPFDYTITNATDQGGCVLDTSIAINGVVLDSIQITNLLVQCEPDKQNYTISFDIIGGTGTYFVNTTPIAGSSYNSGLIPSTMGNWNISVEDDSSCPGISISGEIDCDCPNPGLMSTDTLKSCGDQSIQFTSLPNDGVIIFAQDTFEYFLHDNSGTALGNILDRNINGTFNFIPGQMQYGVVYYISRIVGDFNGVDGVDLSDPCTQNIAIGQPVVWYEIPTALIAGDPIQFLDCQDTILNLDGSGSIPSSAQFQWRLENGASSSSNLQSTGIVARGAGTYILEVSVGNGFCVSADTVVIQNDGDLPTANIPTPQDINCLRNRITLTNNGSSIGPNYTSNWILADGSQINGVNEIEVTQGGTYTLIVTDITNNCRAMTQVVVQENFDFPTVDAGVGGLLACGVDSIILNGTANSPSGSFDAQWYLNASSIPGATGLSLEARLPGVYLLEITDSNNGCRATDSVLVRVDSSAIYNALYDALSPVCPGDRNGEIMVNEVEGGTGPYLFSIDGGGFSPNPEFIFLAEGPHLLTVRDQNGCQWSITIVLDPPSSVEVTMGNDTIIDQGESLILQPQITDPSGEGIIGIDTIYISFVDEISCTNCFNPYVEITPLVPANYEVTVVTESGCIVTDTRFVGIRTERPPFFVPSAFSPNRDGRNDWVSISFADPDFIQEVNNFMIYDRWGNLVFSAETILPKERVQLWDGYFNGETMNPQVFVWTFTVLYKDGIEEFYKGDITLMR